MLAEKNKKAKYNAMKHRIKPTPTFEMALSFFVVIFRWEVIPPPPRYDSLVSFQIIFCYL